MTRSAGTEVARGDRARISVAGEGTIDSAGLVRAHERLLTDVRVRYVACEGGATVLNSLHRAGILDEVFVTVTDVHLEPSEHEAVNRGFAFEAEAAHLITAGRTASDAGYVVRRWRFNEREGLS